jgi:thiamine kinase-like enzyme
MKKVLTLLETTFPQRFSNLADLSWLKLSTPNSGRGPLSKVIFLLFQPNSATPTLCVKTVRSARDNQTITAAYERLQRLRSMIQDSPFSSNFPEPLLIATDSDTGTMVSIETACQGQKASAADIDHIFTLYSEVEKYFWSQQKQGYESIQTCLDEILGSMRIDDTIAEQLRSFMSELGNNEAIVWPRVAQHGDFTLDNVLIDEKGSIGVIDCERFGIINLAGYDIWQLLLRKNGGQLDKVALESLSAHLQSMGGKGVTPTLVALYVLCDTLWKLPAQTKPFSLTELRQRYEKTIALL